MPSGIDGIVRRLCVTSAVAARGAPLQHAVAVEQRDRQAVDLRLGDELERRVLDPLAREVVAHPLHPRPQLRLRAGVGQREHRLQVRDLLEPADRRAADPLGGRVGRDELRVLGLDRAQLVEQLVVLLVADDRVVEDVVALPVVDELLAQLGGALGGAHRRAPPLGPRAPSRIASQLLMPSPAAVPGRTP
jgi:hypothetical protein